VKSWLRLCPLFKVDRPGTQALRGRLADATVWVVPVEHPEPGGPVAHLSLSDRAMRPDKRGNDA
jgi:hypothetical protein